MSKVKTTFFCQKCGTPHPKWQGQCNGCKEWNTLVEEVIEKPKDKGWIEPKALKTKGSQPIRIQEIDTEREPRTSTNDSELNRVLGGGLVPGSVTLLGGEPGIGKSSLLLQISLKIGGKVLYVSGEESQKQIKLRAERIEHKTKIVLYLAKQKPKRFLHKLNYFNPIL